MSIWFCIPSARSFMEARETLGKWRARGYKIALWRDSVDDCQSLCDFLLTGKYPGYANAVNAIVGEVLQFDPSCNWVVAGGDDMEPDANALPGAIAQQCETHFGGTFGVMQPTGDRWGDPVGAYVDRVAGSPWIGRDFCQRINGGRGPLWSEYFHMGVDEELQAVAQRLGIFWQRRDLAHLHQHWGRPSGDRRRMPAFLQKANSPQEWAKYKQIFRSRQAAGFPGHEAIA